MDADVNNGNGRPSSQSKWMMLFRFAVALLVIGLISLREYFPDIDFLGDADADRASLVSSELGGNVKSKIRIPPVPDGFIHGSGKVYRILPDDRDGVPHQKFLIRTGDGESLMVVHNIELAPRIDDVAVGDAVEYCGEFVDNDKGGLVHWTHRDPDGSRLGGWLIHGGRIYR